jgi:carbonic anhydrase/acetyltransferase-like protein (isoleucine patch superfamily)
MAIYELDGQGPDLPADGNFFIADTAVVIGKVRLLSAASVWFGAVLMSGSRSARAPTSRTIRPVIPIPASRL